MRFVLDIEANMLLSNALDYTVMPYRLKSSFKIHCVVIRHIDSNAVKALVQEEITYDNLKHALRKCTELIGHNIVGYDLPVLQLYGVLDYDIAYPDETSICKLFSKPTKLTDTLYWSKLLNADRLGGHSLEAWGKRLGVLKSSFHAFEAYTEEMLNYCVQDTLVSQNLFHVLETEKGIHDWLKPYNMEIKLADLTLKQEVFGFAFNSEKALQHVQTLTDRMKAIAETVNPLLPPKKLTQAKASGYLMPKLRFKKDGLLTSHMTKFLTRIGAELKDKTVMFDGKVFDIDYQHSLRETEPATIEDIDTVKSYLLSLGWIPSEIKERDLTKNTDKTVKKVPEIVEAIDRYVKQTETSVFKELRLQHLDVTGDLRKHLLRLLDEKKPQSKWGKIQPQRPIFVPTTPKLTVGVEKQICPNLVSLGEKADFVKSVVEYYTYRHRKNSISGGAVDEDGESETGFLSCVREDGRIPTPADTLGANTGRYRHKIVCNIPRVTSLFGEEMRELFGAGKGLWQLGYDFASLEARIMGHYVLPFTNGVELAEQLVAEKPNDIHSVNARKLGISRSDAKSFSYAAIYGAQPKKLAKMLKLTEDEGKKLFNEYWEAVPALKELRDNIEKEWESFDKKYILGLDGRLLNTRSKHSLVNVKFQSGGAIAAKWTIVRLAQLLEEQGLLGNPFVNCSSEPKVWFLIAMHDEQQLACHPSLLDVRTFIDEDSAKLFNVENKGSSTVGHSFKGYYVGKQTVPAIAIDNAIATASKELGLKVQLGFDWIPGRNWGMCH